MKTNSEPRVNQVVKVATKFGNLCTNSHQIWRLLSGQMAQDIIEGRMLRQKVSVTEPISSVLLFSKPFRIAE